MNLLQSNFHEAWWIRCCLPNDKTGERNLTKLVISSSRWNARWFGYQGDVEMGLRWFTLSMQHHRHGQKGGTFRAFTGWNLFRICSLGWTSQISGILVTIANKIKTPNFRKASRWFTWISVFDEHRRKLPHNLVCPPLRHKDTQSIFWLATCGEPSRHYSWDWANLHPPCKLEVKLTTVPWLKIPENLGVWQFGNQQYQKNPDYDSPNDVVVILPWFVRTPNPKFFKKQQIHLRVCRTSFWCDVQGCLFAYHDSSTLHHSCVPNSFGRNFGGEHAPILNLNCNILYI